MSKESTDLAAMGIEPAQPEEAKMPPLPPGLATGIADPTPAKEFTQENVPCLRGPCRFYFHCATHFDIQNPAGTFKEGEEPLQHLHYCTSMPGTELELSADSPIYECTHWDPMAVDAVSARQDRRDAYNLQAWKRMPRAKDEDHDDTSTTGDNAG